jgi:hypothetical protein
MIQPYFLHNIWFILLEMWVFKNERRNFLLTAYFLIVASSELLNSQNCYY